jgi:hypothetical protein
VIVIVVLFFALQVNIHGGAIALGHLEYLVCDSYCTEENYTVIEAILVMIVW